MDETGEICPGCSLMYSGGCNMARIIPSCSHNLCEKCIVIDGTNTGQVKCRSPGCSTSMPWTNRLDQFLPNMFILGTVTYRQQSLLQAPVQANVLENVNVNDEIVDVTINSEPQDDKCDILCGECEESTADCFCQSCHSCFCSNCFHKIHKMAKSLTNHKSLPIVSSYDGQKMAQQVKLSNCTDHGKKIEYVAEGGELGCAQCFLFGKLKGVDATTVVDYNKNIKKDVREKIDEGKTKVESLKSVLCGLESERSMKEDMSSEALAKEIKCHFSECHSQLQTLEHQLRQKLEMHQIELTAWQRDIDGLIKSSASKIDKVTNVLQFSEEAISNDAVLDTFNFTEIMSSLTVLDDETIEAMEQARPDPCKLAIEPGFKHHLMSHVILSKSYPSSVSQTTGASSPLASSTPLAPDYSGSSSPSKMTSPIISPTCMAFDSARDSPPPQMASFVSESEPPSPETNPREQFHLTTLLAVTDEFYPQTPVPSIFMNLDFTKSYPPSHMASLVLESELSPSPPSPKVSEQLEKVSVSQLEMQQPEAILQQEIQQPLQVSQQQLEQQEHLSPGISTASSPFYFEHPLSTAQTVCVSYQGENKSTQCIDIDQLFPTSCVEGYDEDEKICASKETKHQKSARGRDREMLSSSLKKSATVNGRKNLIERNLHPRKITKVKAGEAEHSSPTDWNSVLKKSIQKIKAQKQAPNLKRIYKHVTSAQPSLEPISDDIVEKKLDEAVKKGVLERIVKDEKVTFKVTRRPRYKVTRKLWSTPSVSPRDTPLRSLKNEGSALNVSALWNLDKNDFAAMVGLQEKVNV